MARRRPVFRPRCSHVNVCVRDLHSADDRLRRGQGPTPGRVGVRSCHERTQRTPATTSGPSVLRSANPEQRRREPDDRCRVSRRRRGGHRRRDARRAAYVKTGEEALVAARADEAGTVQAYLDAVSRSTTAQELLTWMRRFPEKRTYRPTMPHVRHVGRNEPIAFADLVYALRVRCGLAIRRRAPCPSRPVPRNQSTLRRREQHGRRDPSCRGPLGRCRLLREETRVCKAVSAPGEPDPIDIDAIIRWRAGKGPQPTWRARNGVPLTLD